MEEKRKVYCPKCQDEVTVLISSPPLHGGHASLPDSGEVVCLDFGPQCDSPLCAVFHEPRAVMGVRLARSGQRPERMHTVRALCDGCQQVVELEVIDETHAHCPVCRTINVWTLLRVDGEEWVAVTGPKAEAELG